MQAYVVIINSIKTYSDTINCISEQERIKREQANVKANNIAETRRHAKYRMVDDKHILY